jgi:DNA-directed RNA polymerase II subunit RPB11
VFFEARARWCWRPAYLGCFESSKESIETNIFFFFTGLPNTTIFTFNKEDHTLGNLIASRLHKYGYVTFSAYKMHHPLTPAFDLRVSTDGTVTPRDAVLTCCKDVLVDLDTVSREFTKEMELYRIANAGKPTANTNGNVNGSGPSGTNL